MARLLDGSVGLLQVGGGPCTATKIGDSMWLTAGHCASTSAKIETANTYLYPRSMTIATQDKTEGARKEDWAIINTAGEDEQVPALPLGCNDAVYPGLPVAYLGYPAGADWAVIMGFVSTMRKVRGGRNNADWVLDLPVAGGASGSAIVSMETGNIIAVLTEGVYSQRTGFFMAAAESVRNLDWCEDDNMWRDLFADDAAEEDLPARKYRGRGSIGHT